MRLGVVSMVLLATGLASASAEVTLPCPFSNHMVLQASDRTQFWGTAADGEQIKVQIGKHSGETSADSTGSWHLSLDLQDLVGGPYTLTIEGRNKIVIQDVMVGEVWLAGGQSNMEFQLRKSADAEQEIARSADTHLRQFKVKQAGSLDPRSTCSGYWLAASPTTSGEFTAAGYYFGQDLVRELKHPVGIINSNYGGSNIEAWMSQDALKAFPSIVAAAQPLDSNARMYVDLRAQYEQRYQAWQAKYGRTDPHPNAGGVPKEGWHAIKMQSSFADNSLPDGGVIWLRKRVKVPAGAIGIYLPVHPGDIHGFDTIYWNGKEFGATTAANTTSLNDTAKPTNDRRYDIPGNLVTGDGELAIRIFSPAGPPSLSDMPKNEVAGESVAGDWEEAVEYKAPALSAEARSSFPEPPSVPVTERSLPSALFNAMIQPLLPYSIRGVIWLQGEANTGRAFQYRDEFPAMIEDWRNHWNEGAFPFIFCQLANFQAKNSQPRESNWAELREAQSLVLNVPNTGEAVLIDVGEEADIHFRDKKTVGQRLARIALAETYARPVQFSGPVYQSSSVENSSIRVHFRSTDGGLVAKQLPSSYKPKSTMVNSIPLIRNSPGSELEGFQICGADHKWYWANAAIDGESVVVSSPAVPSPIAVRYGWSNNPTLNLYNKANLPASPFRTDDFPETTRLARF